MSLCPLKSNAAEHNCEYQCGLRFSILYTGTYKTDADDSSFYKRPHSSRDHSNFTTLVHCCRFVPESIILHLRKNKIHKEIDIDFQGLALIQGQICNLVSVVYYGLLISITSIWVSMLKAYVQSRGRDIF